MIRSLLRFTCLAAVIASTSIGKAVVVEEPASSDILLIMPDQMRGDCLSILGHTAIRTPTLDQLAQRGTLFRRTYSTVPFLHSSEVRPDDGPVPADQRCCWFPAKRDYFGHHAAIAGGRRVRHRLGWSRDAPGRSARWSSGIKPKFAVPRTFRTTTTPLT